MADIEISLNDTLEFDTIIQEDSSALKPIGTVTKVSDGSTYSDSFNGFQTKTAVFEPPEPGEFDIPINGQVLTVKVRDPADAPSGGVSFYEFEQDLTDNWSNNSGSIINNISYNETSKYSNYSIESHGNSSDVSEAKLGNFLDTDTFTISFWTYCRSPNVKKPVLVSDEKFDFTISGNFDGNNISFTVGTRQTAYTLNSNQWYHLVGMYDGSKQYFYVDNNKEGESTQNVSFNHTTDPIRLFGIGSENKVYDGLIDNLKFYDRKLTPDEIDNLYNNGSIS